MVIICNTLPIRIITFICIISGMYSTRVCPTHKMWSSLIHFRLHTKDPDSQLGGLIVSCWFCSAINFVTMEYH